MLTVLFHLRRTFRALHLLGGWLHQGWRLWISLALLGVLLGTLGALLQPPRWVSEGEIVLRPQILREGHLLSVSDLGSHYALRLIEEARLARVSATLPALASDPTVRAWHEPGVGIVRLQLYHAGPEIAERFHRALLLDFQAELAAENLTRPEADRLVVTLPRTSFARPATLPWTHAALLGALGGLGLGLLLALLRGAYRHGRLHHPLEVEQLLGAPTLAAIPPR